MKLPDMSLQLLWHITNMQKFGLLLRLFEDLAPSKKQEFHPQKPCQTSVNLHKKIHLQSQIQRLQLKAQSFQAWT